MTPTRFLLICAASALSACAETPTAPSVSQSLTTGGYTPTGNPVLDAAMQASNQAAAQSASAAAVPPAQENVPAPEATTPGPKPGAVEPAAGLAAPNNPAAGAVETAAAPEAVAPHAAAAPPSAIPGVFNGKPLVPAVQTGAVKIECFYSNFPPDRGFIPMEVKVTPTTRLDELVIKVEPEDGVVMRDGPQTKKIATPADPYFRRIFAMRATDRDSYLRVSTVAKTSGSETQSSVLCPLARSNKAPDTGS